MEKSRRRGGGAAVSKKPASVEGNAYGDVFGRPPSFVSPSAASLANYTEIFAGLANSCSIPFLDLPPAFDGFDADLLPAGGSGFDYSEVFGSPDFGEFSSPFEEGLAVPRTEEFHSGDVRTTEEATGNQLATGQLDFSTGLSDRGRSVDRVGGWSLSNSNRSNNGSINVLQNSSIKQNEESKEIHLKDAPVWNCGADGALKKLSDSINNVKEQKKGTQVTHSSYSSNSSENYLRAEKHLTNKYPVSENGNAKERHHSHSSSSSKLSVDVSSNDIMYVTVSDISLRTQPLGIAPPSRPPPRLSDEEGSIKPQMLSTCKSFPDEGRLLNLVAKDEDIHVHQEIVKENSSFFDAEVDASSAAAASASAMREAMLLAQAKLKSAKELMEKKRYISQNSKKLGPCEISKYKECKLAPVMMEQESLEEKAASIDKRNEITCGSKLTLHCEKEKVAVFDVDDERQGNDLQSSQPSEPENKSERWKTDKEYHELVSTAKYEMTDAAFEMEPLMQKKKIRTEICEIKQNENMKDALSYEIESNRTLRKDCGTPAAGVNEENANREAYDSNLEEVGKERKVHKLHGQGERDTSCEGDKATSFAKSGDKVRRSHNSNLHYVNDNQDGNPKVEAASVTCVYESFSNLVDINEIKEESKKEKGKLDADKCQVENFEKKINITNIAFEPGKGEEKLNVAETTPAQEAAELQGAHRSSISKVERIEACKCPDSENTRLEEKQCCALNVNQIERKIEVCEQEKGGDIHMKELFKSIENDLSHKVDELMEQKSIVEAMTCGEQLKLKVEKVDCCRDCNGNETKETQFEPQRSDKKEDNTPETYNFETIVAQKMYEQDHQCENQGIIEMQIEPRFMDKIISINTVPVVCIRPLGMTLNVQPANLAGEVGDDMSTVVTKNSMPVSQKNVSDIKREEEYEKERMERERQTEKWDKILEEKEKTGLVDEKKQMLRKLKEDTERAILLEAKIREREFEEETEQTKLVDQRGRERKSKGEKDQVMILEELKERTKKLEKEKQQAKLLHKPKEDEKKAELNHARILEETKNKERKLPEDKEEKRFSENAKENKLKLEDGKRRLETEEVKYRERIFEQEKELTRVLDEEKERGREREKDRAAVERAIREAHERAFAEARERAEKIAAERATSEPWQRASKEVQTKGDKATSEILEKLPTEKASRDARLRAERAAVERANAEARERAVEKALAEKAAANAREHAERHNATSRDRMRKNADAEELSKSRDKILRQLQDGPCDAQLRSTGSLSSYQPNLDSNDQRQDESVLRSKARLERHQRIADRAAKALAEKNIRDILAQREQAERNRLAEHLDSDIKRWSNGKEGNLRALLSTLQYILGPESGWQPIPLTDVITASAVKKAYRKATLCVHPDKLQQRGATIQQKYICEKVFDLLKEAWNRFNSEER